MKDLYEQFTEYAKKWKNEETVIRIRHGILMYIESGLVNTLKSAEKKLTEWFGRKLFNSGRILKELETFSHRENFGQLGGLNLSVTAEKGKINIGRWVGHLTTIIDQQASQIDFYSKQVKRLEEEFGAERIRINHEWQGKYLEEEDFIIQLFSNKDASDKIRTEIKEKFGRLLPCAVFCCAECDYFNPSGFDDGWGKCNHRANYDEDVEEGESKRENVPACENFVAKK